MQRNLNYLDRNFTDRGKFTYHSSYPIIYFDDKSVSKKLLEHKIITTSFKYTNASGKLNRIVITANHSIEDLEHLIAQLT